MQIPILKQGDYLIAVLQTNATDSDWQRMGDELATLVTRHRSRGVLLDVSTLDFVDSFMARMLRSITQTVRLRGAQAVVVGIQPEVAFAMAQLGLALDFIDTALDLDEGIELLQRRLGSR